MRWLLFKGFLWNLGDFGVVVDRLIADLVGRVVAMVAASSLLAGWLECCAVMRFSSVIVPCLLCSSGFWSRTRVDDGVIGLLGDV